MFLYGLYTVFFRHGTLLNEIYLERAQILKLLRNTIEDCKGDLQSLHGNTSIKGRFPYDRKSFPFEKKFTLTLYILRMVTGQY